MDEKEIEEETSKKKNSLLLYVCMSVDEWEFFLHIKLLSDQQSFQSLFLNYFANVWIFHPCTHSDVKIEFM